MKRASTRRLKQLWLWLVLLALGQTVTVFAAPPVQGPNPLAALQSASSERVVVGYHPTTGAADFLSGAIPTSGNSADARSRNFLKTYGQLFGVRDAQAELSVMRASTDDIGMSHVVYAQQYRGVPVFGARLVVHLDRDGRVRAVNGQFQPGITLSDVTAAISADEAQHIAHAALKADSVEWQLAPRLVIWTHNAGGKAARLTWEVLGFAQEPLGRWHYFVDARTGDVAYHLNELDTGDVVHQPNGRPAGVSPPKPTALPAAKNRTVYNANNGSSLPGTLMCNEGSPSGCNSDSSAQAAFNNSGIVYDYYKNNFNRDSYNNAGAALISTVHFGVSYNNAFWNGSQMVYGDGDGVIFSPLALALDVDAHELTHAVTQSTSNLFYEGQSGALNESYSDVFGVFVDPANWQIGESVYIPDPVRGLRDLSDPTKGGLWNPNNPYGSSAQPDNMSVIAVLPDGLDNGGVHINSGIPNKVGYLMTNGGTFRGITVAGLGFTKSPQIIYRTQTTYNTPFTSFGNAAQNTVRACQDLIGQFGITSNDCNSVLNAWAAVGVGPSAAQTFKTFLPTVIKGDTTPGISGLVTLNGAAAGGQSIELRNCNANTGICNSAGFSTTDSNGAYRFTPAALSAGFYYYVRTNQTSSCSLWYRWIGNRIPQYNGSEAKAGGDFDLAPIGLVSPTGSVTGTTQNFIWSTRTLPAGAIQDLPELVVYTYPSFTTIYDSGPLARGTTSKSVSGFTSASYYWEMWASAASGYGIPNCGNIFTSSLAGLTSGFGNGELIRLPNRDDEHFSEARYPARAASPAAP